MRKQKKNDYIPLHTRIAKEVLDLGINPFKATLYFDRMGPIKLHSRYVFEALRLQGGVCKYVFEPGVETSVQQAVS